MRAREGSVAERKSTAMAEKVRSSLELGRELDPMLQEIPEEAATTKNDVLRRALALVEVAHDAEKEQCYLGLVKDRTKLDTEIVGLP